MLLYIALDAAAGQLGRSYRSDGKYSTASVKIPRILYSNPRSHPGGYPYHVESYIRLLFWLVT